MDAEHVTRRTEGEGQVVFLEYEPEDGLRYAVFVSDLPGEDIEDGRPGSHRLITVTSPVIGAYVMEAVGPVFRSRVQEKIGHGRAVSLGVSEDLTDEQVTFLTEAIAMALGSERVL